MILDKFENKVSTSVENSVVINKGNNGQSREQFGESKLTEYPHNVPCQTPETHKSLTTKCEMDAKTKHAIHHAK